MYLEYCNENQLKKVYEEFNVTEETVQRDVQALKKWLKQQPYLPNVEDESLLRLYFIRCKTSLEKAKQMLELFYVSKALLPKLFANRDPTSAEFRNVYNNVGNILPMPKLTPEVNRVLIGRIFKDAPNNKLPNVDTTSRVAVTAMTLTDVISGIHKKFIMVFDCKYFTASMLPLILAIIREVYVFVLKHSPMLIEAVYILNSPILLDPGISLAKKISPKIFGERLIIWKKSDHDLAEVIPKESLPNEYGGTAGSYDELSERYLKELESWKGWVDEENKCVADLRKVPEDRKRKLDMGEFGVKGSFRKFDVD